jgi:hypothetical protein
MATNQGGVQEAVRAVSGTAKDYNSDWHALFDAKGIANGPFNGRMLAWINSVLSASYADLPGAMQAFAVNQGFNNWSSMNTFSIGPSVPSSAVIWGASNEMIWGSANYITWG